MKLSVRLLLAGLILLGGVLPAAATVTGKEIDYRAGDAQLKGYLAWDPQLQGKRPAILVVHEWWGNNDYARRRARMLAELGYVALAVDMYGKGVQATTTDEAGMLAAMVNQHRGVVTERFLAALDLLKAQPQTDPARLAAIGYCFGGGVVLQMARNGIDLKGVASFHGSLATEIEPRPGTVKAKIFVAHGGADTLVSGDDVEDFVGEMLLAGADFRLFNYPGAKHSFTNPAADEYARKFNLPIAYSPEADRRSWADLQAFLKELFGE